MRVVVQKCNRDRFGVRRRDRYDECDDGISASSASFSRQRGFYYEKGGVDALSNSACSVVVIGVV